MKVLYTNFHDGDGGGHTTYLTALARGLSARPGFEIHVAAPPGSRLFKEASQLPAVRTLAQPFPNGLGKLGAWLRARRQLRAYLRANAFDIVHVNGSADHRLVISAARGLRPRPRIVLTKHNSKPMRGLGHALRARGGTDQVIAVCEYTRRELQDTAYRRCRLATVHNGVDLSHYAPWPEPAAHAARAAWTADSNVLLLGSNAGTADYKGWTDLSDALMRLSAEERARIRVIVAGRPPAQEQVQRLDPAIRELFHFPGLLSDVRPLIAAMDAGFVLSHDVETISFACREMMAMGKPVMVTDYAGLPENIHAGTDGWVVPVHGHAGMAEALRGMLRDRARLSAMGQAAHAHAIEEFGIERFIQRTEDVYRGLLASGRR